MGRALSGRCPPAVPFGSGAGRTGQPGGWAPPTARRAARRAPHPPDKCGAKSGASSGGLMGVASGGGGAWRQALHNVGTLGHSVPLRDGVCIAQELPSALMRTGGDSILATCIHLNRGGPRDDRDYPERRGDDAMAPDNPGDPRGDAGVRGAPRLPTRQNHSGVPTIGRGTPRTAPGIGAGCSPWSCRRIGKNGGNE